MKLESTIFKAPLLSIAMLNPSIVKPVIMTDEREVVTRNCVSSLSLGELTKTLAPLPENINSP